ncbi:MAG: ankyrin repeat domain-containing protein [Candidatus Dependentiae bacterium]|nr:ankyrin repeat domain-containing protein [Candidatus Dependentiae bacterium]
MKKVSLLVMSAALYGIYMPPMIARQQQKQDKKEANKEFADAVKRGNQFNIKKALEAGADNVNVKNSAGKTALIFVVAADDLDTMRKLIALDADINTADKEGMTPLMFAVWTGGNPDLIKELVISGADITRKDNQGRTAEEIAKKMKSKTNKKLMSSKKMPSKEKKRIQKDIKSFDKIIALLEDFKKQTEDETK